MKVAVNAVHLVPFSGLEDLYVRNAIPALGALPDAPECVLLTDPVNHETFEGFERVCVQPSHGRRGGIDGPLRQALAELQPGRVLTLPGNVPSSSPAPMLPLMLNLEPLEQPRGFFRWWGEVRMKHVHRAVHRAPAVVAPSAHARKRLLAEMDLPLDRAAVAPPGVDHLRPSPQPPSVEPPYLLSVGLGRIPRGVERLVAAFSALEDRIPHSLVIVGEPGESEPAEWAGRVVRIHQCPASQRVGLYQHADLVVQSDPEDVSGYLVLEAAYAGGRVMAPRGGAVAAVAPGVGISCDPGNIKAFASAILHALDESPEQRDSRVKAGRHIAAEYTWKRCAEKVATALKRG
jgi:glycosyltransferase involved in cell wall biosynthesis